MFDFLQLVLCLCFTQVNVYLLTFLVSCMRTLVSLFLLCSASVAYAQTSPVDTAAQVASIESGFAPLAGLGTERQQSTGPTTSGAHTATVAGFSGGVGPFQSSTLSRYAMVKPGVAVVSVVGIPATATSDKLTDLRRPDVTNVAAVP